MFWELKQLSTKRPLNPNQPFVSANSEHTVTGPCPTLCNARSATRCHSIPSHTSVVAGKLVTFQWIGVRVEDVIDVDSRHKEICECVQSVVTA